MSGHDKHNPDLPLPSPRSPDSLDERILTRARENVAGERSSVIPNWVAGIATVGIAGLAVLLALPLQQDLETEQPYPVEMESPGASPPAPTLSAKAEMSSDSAITAGRAAPDAEQFREKRQVTHADEAIATAQKRVAAKQEAVEATAMDAGAAKERAFRAELGLAEPSPQAKTARYTEQDLETDLSRCGELLADTERQAAETCYAELLKNCSVCDLPPRLEDALKMLPPETAAPTR